MNISTITILFFVTVASDTNFYHLKGYIILADPLKSVSDVDVIECAEKCEEIGFQCIGFEYTSKDGCVILNGIRNIIFDSMACSFFVVDRIEEQSSSKFVASLNLTEQLIFSNAYGISAPCPTGFADNTTFCCSMIEESKCNEYADFFNTTFNGSHCIIKVNRPEYYCAGKVNPEKILFSTEYFGYCYFKATASAKNMNSFTEICKSLSPKSSPAKICSWPENQFVTSITTEWPTFFGLNLSANKTSRIYECSKNEEEICEFRNWMLETSELVGQPNAYTNNTETIVGIMSKDGFWADYSTSTASSSTNVVICQENALTLMEYAEECQSIDKCEQL